MKWPITIIILLGLCHLSCISYAQKNQAAINANKNAQDSQPSNVPGQAPNSNLSAGPVISSGPQLEPISPSDSENEPTSDELERTLPEELRKQIACTIEETVTITPDGGGAAPLKLTFDAGESTAPCGKIVKWSWTFGDGSKGSGVKVTHTYQTPGSYSATLKMRDSKGNRNDLVIEYAVAVN